MKMIKNVIIVSVTTDRAILATFTATYKEYKETY